MITLAKTKAVFILTREIKMIEWYSNKKVGIFFDYVPEIKVREFHYNNLISKEENEKRKRNIEKYPFELMNDIQVEIVDYKSDKEYRFLISKNYRYDGASIPKLFFRIIGANTDNRFLIASMVHDVLCENHFYIDYNRKLSSEIFNALLEASGVNPFKRWLMKNSVDNYQKLCHWKGG